MNTLVAGTDLPALLAHAAWVRRLAGCLVRDDALADDLTQETFMAALRHPPAAELPPRPWLGQVVRNLVRMRARGERRRGAREEAVAADPADPVESPEQLVARAQAQQSLASLVVGLAEPYRATVLLRFYEGLSAADIAARQGVPAGTVRWRLKTALDQLRTELDRSHNGDRHAWQLALAPLGAWPTTEPYGPGVLSGLTRARAGLLAKSLMSAAVVLVGVTGGLLATRPKTAPPPMHAPSAPVAASRPQTPAVAPLRQLDRQQRAQLLQRLAVSHHAPKPAAGASAVDASELDKEYIRTQITALLPLIKECYENALITQPALAGKLVVDFTIIAEPDIGGLVSQSAINDAESTITDAPMRECVQETMYAAQFPAPLDGGEVRVTYPFMFASAK
ncbi:MAG TPA: sigma-70 family RNA polymerase sigma factor [Pseudomonadota bacterium]|nr:sigma-70 family RNA polymerase sigma factor [Pseudomonadota bacterium]